VQQRSTPEKREAAVAGLASEGLALVAGSAGAGSSAVDSCVAHFLWMGLRDPNTQTNPNKTKKQKQSNAHLSNHLPVPLLDNSIMIVIVVSVDCLVHVTGEFKSVNSVSNPQASQCQMSLNSSQTGQQHPVQ